MPEFERCQKGIHTFDTSKHPFCPDCVKESSSEKIGKCFRMENGNTETGKTRSAASSMTLRWHGVTLRGGRDQNQDFLAVSFKGEDEFLAVVCDGMGGHEGGEKASALAANNLINAFHQAQPASDPKAFIQKALMETHSCLNKMGAENPDLTSTGTTIIAAFIKNQELICMHIGDSRLYHFREKFLYRTRDHSAVEILFMQNKISEAEMASHPDQNKLFRALGGKVEPQPTYTTYPENKNSTRLENGDILVLCSDGLWELVPPDEMVRAITNSGAVYGVKSLVETANKRGIERGGGHDNITCFAVQVEIGHGSGKEMKDAVPAKSTGRWVLAFILVAAILGIGLFLGTNHRKIKDLLVGPSETIELQDQSETEVKAAPQAETTPQVDPTHQAASEPKPEVVDTSNESPAATAVRTDNNPDGPEETQIEYGANNQGGPSTVENREVENRGESEIRPESAQDSMDQTRDDTQESQTFEPIQTDEDRDPDTREVKTEIDPPASSMDRAEVDDDSDQPPVGNDAQSGDDAHRLDPAQSENGVDDQNESPATADREAENHGEKETSSDPRQDTLEQTNNETEEKRIGRSESNIKKYYNDITAPFLNK